MTTHKYFFVKIELRNGDYEKDTCSLVMANDEAQARMFALQLEAHCDLEDLEHDDEWRSSYDDASGTAYRISSVVLVESYEEVQTLKKYLGIH